MFLVTAATKSTTTTNSQTDAHYDFQIRQQHQPSTFHGPARQFGSGGMDAFAMRMGRVAMPLMKKYVLPGAKEFGRNLVSSFVPELANIVSGKKRTRKTVPDILKNSATEAGAGAVVAGNGGAAGGRAIRCRRGGHSRLENVQQVSKLHQSMLSCPTTTTLLPQKKSF